MREVRLGKFQQFFFKRGARPEHYWGRVGPGIDMQSNRLNRRKSERRLCKSFAKIQFGTNSLPRDCTITDMSAGGVKVIAEHLDALPAEFTIILSTGDPRQCRLAWRIGHEFGAEFVD